jgi:phenylpyruvate tautomerase PptA (4-oxalocrotonate tautomerase family)
MPYINFRTSLTLTPEKETELKAALGRAIAAIPGKSETYTMVEIEGGAHMWLGGNNSKPLAMINVKILGHAKPADFSKMTGELCDLCQKLLGIDPTGVYATYDEVENWGWNGKNF